MKRDDLIFDIIEKEHQRQLKGIELIASENFVSDEVMQAMGSCLTNKYAEGYPGKRYYGGCEVVDQSEQIAIDRIKKIFGAEWANVLELGTWRTLVSRFCRKYFRYHLYTVRIQSEQRNRTCRLRPNGGNRSS